MGGHVALCRSAEFITFSIYIAHCQANDICRALQRAVIYLLSCVLIIEVTLPISIRYSLLHLINMRSFFNFIDVPVHSQTPVCRKDFIPRRVHGGAAFSCLST
jgi:hypothetical protein